MNQNNYAFPSHFVFFLSDLFVFLSILCLFLCLSFLFNLFGNVFFHLYFLQLVWIYITSVFLSFFFLISCLFLHNFCLSFTLILCFFQHDFYLSVFLSFLFYLLIYEYHEVSQKRVNMDVHHHLWDFPFIPSQTLKSNRI